MSLNSDQIETRRQSPFGAAARHRREFGYVLQRLAAAAGLLLLVSVLVFLGLALLPGDAAQAILGKAANAANLAELRAKLGLDQPLWSRYFTWAHGIVQGDLGTSFVNRRPVADTVLPRLATSLTLAGLAALVTIPLSVLLGLRAARHPGGWIDRLITTLARVTVAAPEFFTGYLAILIFALWLGWLPSSARIPANAGLVQTLQALALPVLVLFLAVAGHVVVTVRAALLDVLQQPYIEMARLKGVGDSRILWRHALPNAIGPVVNVAMVNLAYMVAGVVVVETIFALPGLGQYLVDSVSKRDLPVVQACSLIFAALYIVLNLIADLAATFGTPRLRSRI